MGKAKILSVGDSCSYTVELDYGTEARDERVEKIDKRLAELGPKIQEAKGKLQEAKAAEDQAKVAAEQAIDDYVAATQATTQAFNAASAAGSALDSLSKSTLATPAEIKAAKATLTAAEAAYKAAQEHAKAKITAQADAAKKLVEARKKTAPLQLALDLLSDENKQLQKDRAYYGSLALKDSKQAWCTDYTDDAEGEVATIEIPGESALVLIKGGAEKPKEEDGELRAREMQSPEQVFFNAAILPGWQKFMPTYRRGKITELDTEANTASVALYDAKSSAQALDINQAKALEKVPVKYMDCDALAFEVGDDCVVMFEEQKWESPQVIGFVTHPRPCGLSGIGVEVMGDDGEKMCIILRPQGSYGQPSGEWREQRVDRIVGGPHTVQPWQYPAVRREYVVPWGGGALRGNAEVGPPGIGGQYIFSAYSESKNKAEQYIVSVSKPELDDMKVTLRRGTLAKLKKDDIEPLPVVAEFTFEEWHACGVHPSGKKFLAYRIAYHKSPDESVTYATVIDQVSWFDINSSGTVTEGSSVYSGDGYIVTEFGTPEPDPGQKIPYTSLSENYDFELVTQAHVSVDGDAVVSWQRVAGGRADKSYHNPKFIKRKSWVSRGDGYKLVSDRTQEINIVKLLVGSSEDDEYTYSEHATGVGRINEIDVLYENIRAGVQVTLETTLEIDTDKLYKKFTVNDGEVNPETGIINYYWKSVAMSLNATRKQVLQLRINGNVVREIEELDDDSVSKSYEAKFIYDSTSTTHLAHTVFGQYTRAFDYLGGLFLLADDLLPALNEFYFDFIGAGTDAFTGAIVMNFSAGNVAHWFVIENSSVKGIGAVSKLIPPSATALLLVSV